LLEAPGNRRPRGMAVTPAGSRPQAIQNPAYRQTDAYLRAPGGIPSGARQVSGRAPLACGLNKHWAASQWDAVAPLQIIGSFFYV
jgi:hypothetical protein